MDTVTTKIYDELSRVLTDYDENLVGERELYEMLCKIQNNWDWIICQK